MESSSSSAAAAAEVPPYFLCPISLEIMRDPVTLPTGITYDRASIERWLFGATGGDWSKQAVVPTCPVTRRALAPAEREATPNHTLRRLIQAWCAAHAVERFPTPRPPVDPCRVAALVDEGTLGGRHQRLAALREIKAVAAESDRNRRCVEATPGAVEFLVSLVTAAISTPSSISTSMSADDLFDSPMSSTSSPEEDALGVLYSLKPSETTLLRILDKSDGGGNLLDTLAAALRRPSYRTRACAILLLKAITSAMSPERLMHVSTDLVEEVVRVIADGVSTKAVKAALHVLCRLCPWGRNRVKAVEAGAVAALVELLLDGAGAGEVAAVGRRAVELAVAAIGHVCGCAEGRAELVEHPAGLAVVSKRAMRVSPAATESAVRALHAVARHAATPAVLQEMLAVGVVAKLLLVLQVDGGGAGGERARARAREMLKANARVWKDSPCLQAHLKASYPS